MGYSKGFDSIYYLPARKRRRKKRAYSKGFDSMYYRPPQSARENFGVQSVSEADRTHDSENGAALFIGPRAGVL